MQIENRTPHQIGLVREDGTRVTIRPTRPAVRIKTDPGPPAGSLDGVAVFGPPRFDRILNLPKPRDGIAIVVSQLAALAIHALAPERTDVFYPGTAPEDGAERDEADTGRVLYVSRLIRAS